MRTAGALAAFVAGAWILQQQPVLPGVALLGVLGFLGGATLLVCTEIIRRQRCVAGGAARTWLVQEGCLIAALVLGAVHAALWAHWQLADELAFADERRDVIVTGVIASLPAQLMRGTRFEFDVLSAETPGVHVPAHVSLGWYSTGRVRPGELWRFGVRLRRPHGALNPGGFDLEAWMLERGLRASGYVRDVAASPPQRLAAMTWSPGYMVDRARDVLRERLQARLLDARYGGVLLALVLGDQRAISEDDWLLFNRTGISHLVSISGLHITMIAGLVAWLVRWLWRRSARTLSLAPTQLAAAWAAMLAALGYCLLAGWGVPAQRTFFMLATVAAALLLRLRTRPATTLALAAAVVMLLDPWAVLAPGFWLSFGAVAAIFFAMHGRVSAPAGWRRQLAEATRTQWVVTLALVPLTVVLFQQVSVISPLANAIAIPLVSLVVTPLALVGACFVLLPDPVAWIATPLLFLANGLMAWLAGFLAVCAKWPAATVTVAAPPAWAALLAVAGVGWMLAPPGWPVRWAGLLGMLPLWAWPPERPQDGALWVTALDVGQGAALVVETAGGVLIYDAGPRYSPQADAGSRIVGPYLRWRGIGRIDTLMLSHLDSDHSGGAASLVKSFDVARVWTSIDAAAPILASTRSVRRCFAGDEGAVGDARIRLLSPTAAEYALPPRNTNARSCVAEVHLGRWRVLLTGDLPAAQEIKLLDHTRRQRADLVVAPHHGSRSSSSEPFVSATAPTWVAVQAGYRNRFGHPDAAVVARYRATGAQVLRTDEAGAIQWRFQPGGVVGVHRQRVDARRYWHNQPGPAVTIILPPETCSEEAGEDTSSRNDEPPDPAFDRVE
jgi:competence protein ComEC